jgi:hypothetical protein
LIPVIQNLELDEMFVAIFVNVKEDAEYELRGCNTDPTEYVDIEPCGPRNPIGPGAPCVP